MISNLKNLIHIMLNLHVEMGSIQNCSIDNNKKKKLKAGPSPRKKKVTAAAKPQFPKLEAVNIICDLI